MTKTVYLDTTIPSYLFDERESLKNYIEVTKAWWAQEREKFDIYVSEETMAELKRGNYPNKLKILECMSKFEVLSLNERITKITQEYVDNYVMPRVLEGDARHLAYASFYEMDFLLTWNCNHLANANKKQHIQVINKRLKLSTPEIVTPLTLFTETT
jgi:predicted nucleic acid-binding protein